MASIATGAGSAGACLSRSRQPGGRQQRRDRAARSQPLVHARTRTRLHQRDSDERSRAAGRSRKCASAAGRTGGTPGRAPAAAAGHVYGQLARRVGRYPPDGGDASSSRLGDDRPDRSAGKGNAVNDALVIARLVQFAAAMAAFGASAFRFYAVGWRSLGSWGACRRALRCLEQSAPVDQRADHASVGDRDCSACRGENGGGGERGGRSGDNRNGALCNRIRAPRGACICCSCFC